MPLEPGGSRQLVFLWRMLKGDKHRPAPCPPRGRRIPLYVPPKRGGYGTKTCSTLPNSGGNEDHHCLSLSTKSDPTFASLTITCVFYFQQYTLYNSYLLPALHHHAGQSLPQEGEESGQEEGPEGDKTGVVAPGEGGGGRRGWGGVRFFEGLLRRRWPPRGWRGA